MQTQFMTEEGKQIVGDHQLICELHRANSALFSIRWALLDPVHHAFSASQRSQIADTLADMAKQIKEAQSNIEA